ncbi:phosphatidylserine/phosphatidylglycerophosphate/cardiolipin synthase family protein [Bacteriovoracales bacterium]|nr:phosphatidylserine/phosphatidylglycerophosphate/cardiolipin synthase family protein [Bacteriovoracales bacterium]
MHTYLFKHIFILSMAFSFSTYAINVQQKKENKWKGITDKHLSKSDTSFCSKDHYKIKPPRLSSLMKKLLKDISPYVKKGTVDSFRFFSGINYASRRVYRTNDEIFDLTKGLIENAQHEVLLQTYLYQKNSKSVVKLREGIENLEKRLKQEEKRGKKIKPVVVKILIDNQSGLVGKIIAKQGWLFKGLDFKNPDGPDVYGLGFAKPVDKKYVRLEVQLYNHTLLGANHSKSVVVDRSMGIVMGANLMKYHDKFKKWGNISPETDHGFFVMGSIGKGLAQDFYFAWEKGDKYVTNDPANMVPRSPFEQIEGMKRFKIPKLVKQWTTKRILENNVPMVLLTKKAVNKPWKRKGDNPQDKGLLSLFKNAKHNINFVTPNLNARPIIDGLLNAIKRGVDINIVLSKNYQDSIGVIPGVGGTNLKNVKKILKKIKKFRKKNPRKKVGKFNIRWFVDRKGRLSREYGTDKDKLSKWTSHTKYMSIDNQVTIVGSTNMDNQSYYYSRELNIAIDHYEITRKWCNLVFRTDFLRAKPFDPNEK